MRLVGTPLVRRELLEDERRWTLIFAAINGVVALLVSIYDVEAESYGTLLAVSMAPVLFHLARAAAPTIPAWPVAPLAGLVQILAVLIDDEAEGHTFLVILALFYVFFREPNRLAARLGLIVVAPMPFIQYITDSIDSDGWLFWSMGYLVCAWFGHLAFSLRTLAAELEAQRAETAARAVHLERREIARDVHDIVGHSLSVVLLHLTAARRTVAESPEEAEAGLRQAEQVGREAMAEIRNTMALLADPERPSTIAQAGMVDPTPGRDSSPDPEPSVPAATQPVLMLGDVRQLVDRYRSAAIDVDLVIDGDPSRLSVSAGLAGYRIVQEALVNATKHGRPGPISVTVDVGADDCVIRVENERPPLAPGARRRPGVEGPETGLGLVGMRERARSVRGTLQAGPVPALQAHPSGRGAGVGAVVGPKVDRWLVEAVLPIGGARG